MATRTTDAGVSIHVLYVAGGHGEDDVVHAVETTRIGQVCSGPPPSTFDEADRCDLERLRTGRL